MNRIADIEERVNHFQWIVDTLDEKGKTYYLEKDWYDNPTLISKEDAKKELERITAEIKIKEK